MTELEETCAHCGRTADSESGYATIGDERVCHPNRPDRPDCYRLVTVYDETLGSRIKENTQ